MNEVFEFFSNIINIVVEYWPYFLRGTRNTVVLSFLAVIGGCILGMGLTMLRMSKVTILKKFACGYISLFRGVPVIVQLWIFYFQLSRIITFPEGLFLDMDISRLLPCLFALSCNSAAYVAEILRAGIESVDKGQMEAARSIGMPQSMAMRKIVFPQAVKNVLPAICNEFITLVKETAIIQYLGIADLMYSMGAVKSMTFMMLENYYIVGFIYFILNYFASKGVALIEKKLSTDVPIKVDTKKLARNSRKAVKL